MPCLSGRYESGIGPLINIGVFPCGSFQSVKIPIGQMSTFPALIDTGASVTCISADVAKTAGLQPIGMRPMISATQAVPVNVYLVDLLLPFGNAGFILPGSLVMEFIPTAGSSFQILVGRDIICQGALTISFDGHFTFSL